MVVLLYLLVVVVLRADLACVQAHPLSSSPAVLSEVLVADRDPGRRRIEEEAVTVSNGHIWPFSAPNRRKWPTSTVLRAHIDPLDRQTEYISGLYMILGVRNTGYLK